MAKGSKKPATRTPSEQDYLDQMRIVKASGPHLRGPNDRPPVPSSWEYEFLVQLGRYDYRFPVAIDESVAERDRDQIAKDVFKETVALIAKKVAAF